MAYRNLLGDRAGAQRADSLSHTKYICRVSSVPCAQIGTPPVDFPVAIDSGSGDLDVSGKGCTGCVTTPPNKGYDASASSTSHRVFPYVFSNTYQTCDLKNPTAPCTISGGLYKDQATLMTLNRLLLMLRVPCLYGSLLVVVAGVFGWTGTGGGHPSSSHPTSLTVI